jgi:hypothetical protein
MGFAVVAVAFLATAGFVGALFVLRVVVGVRAMRKEQQKRAGTQPLCPVCMKVWPVRPPAIAEGIVRCAFCQQAG